MSFSFSACWEDSESIHIVVFLSFFIDSTDIPKIYKIPEIQNFNAIKLCNFDLRFEFYVPENPEKSIF